MQLCFSHLRPRRALLQTGLLACALISAQAAPAAPQADTPGLVFGPYKHLLTHVDPNNPTATTRATGTAALLPGANSLTLAFASGECGQERRKARDATVLHPDSSTTVDTVDLDAEAVAHANLAALHAAPASTPWASRCWPRSARPIW